MIQPLGGRREGAFGGEGADMKFVDDAAGQLPAVPFWSVQVKVSGS